MIEWLAGMLMAAGPQAAAATQRPEVAVVVVTLDEARQGQIKHGRSLLRVLGDERWGRLRLVEPTVPVEDFRDCEEDSADYGLDHCARFYLHRALTPGLTPHVVVAFADWNEASPRQRGGAEMRVLCFGRGAEAADAGAQDTWLWPDSARVHGVRDWERDQDALAACIEAAMSEPPEEPRP